MVNAMHKLSLTIADACVARQWISEQEKPWCIYALETKLLSSVFFLFLTMIALVLGKLPETVIFSAVFYVLRQRYGGWHAPYAWLCQGISLTLILGAVLCLGPAMLMLPPAVVWGVNIAVMAIALIRQPVYPAQVHFDQEIKTANHQKKNHILCVIIGLQIVLGFFYRKMLIYSLLAVLAGILSVYIEIMRQRIQRRKVNNEVS